jgi:hypothetical protein
LRVTYKAGTIASVYTLDKPAERAHIDPPGREKKLDENLPASREVEQGPCF